MSKVGMIIDFSKHTAIINKRHVKLKRTQSGHYGLPISLWLNKSSKHIVLMAMGDKQTCVRTMARKLHLQFAHPRAETLKKTGQ